MIGGLEKGGQGMKKNQNLAPNQAVGVSGSKSVSNYRVIYWLVPPKIGDFCPVQPKKASMFWGF